MRAQQVVACALLVGGCSFDLTAIASDAPTDVDAPTIDGPAVPACFGALCRRTTLRVDRTRVAGGPHLSFPVLVDVTLPDLAVAASPTGLDLTFTAADGTTRLRHERELFVDGHLVAWVTVPSVEAATDTVFYLYYGDRTATVDAEFPSGVWGTDYAGVWHLEDPAAGTMVADSTIRGHLGIAEGGLTLAAAGKIGRGMQLDGSDDRLRVPTTPELEAATNFATLSLWVNFTAAQTANAQRILMTAPALQGGGEGMEWGSQATGGQDLHYIYPSDAGGSNYHGIVSPFVSGQWHHVAVTIDFPNKAVAMFVDGQVRTPFTPITSTTWTRRPMPADWFFGGVPPYTRLAGRMDEIRVATVVRSADWIATEFANQSAPTTFVVPGATAIDP